MVATKTEIGEVAARSGRFLVMDAAQFDPRKSMAFTHSLSDHPLLTLESVSKLALRLPPPGDVRWFSGQAAAGSNLRNLVTTHGNGSSLEATLDNIEAPGSWVGLHLIENDPEYRELIEEILDEVQAMTEKVDPGMHQRVGYIFIAAPGAVFPWHQDPENGFLFQTKGTKVVHAWDTGETSVVSEAAMEAFFANRPSEEREYKPEYESKAKVYHVGPTDGVYLPWGGPHYVQVGPEGYSVAINVSYRTRTTELRRNVHHANDVLRRKGLRPSPVGQSPTGDQVKYWVYRAGIGVKSLLKPGK